ncbi:arginine N-succinyltransferase [Novosphingobium sp. RD2P27]|uniref:Arginine N-succinyltransferase n=1 Tax=Novosphingobium kalidii TaxID=3230299 RepID=A0ABV2D354_9SPHN
MTFLVRAARESDLAALYRMAKSTGGGFTNLPPNRAALEGKLARSAECFGRKEDTPADDLFVFILEDTAENRAAGTCQVFAQIGTRMPFYSYRIGTMTQHSQELDRTFRAELLTLCTDLDGASEIGGLFLEAAERSAGVGKLLARSRYLFIAMHRARFADQTLAELRGAHDDAGNSPFWDGLAGRFFDMSFVEADEFNGRHGNQFITDLMPKHPIYTALLPASARAVMGQPHVTGRPAMRMLEQEGFAFANYIDIFDGGPTMIARTDQIRTVREAGTTQIEAVSERDGEPSHIVACGHLADFRACLGCLSHNESGATLDPRAAALLNVSSSDTVTYAPL